MISSTERLLFLLDLTKSDPNDPFGWYGLALEYMKSDLKKASETFEYLVLTFPQYLPSYYQYALVLTEKDAIKEAIGILDKGLVIAENQNNTHAKAEIMNLRQNILMELD